MTLAVKTEGASHFTARPELVEGCASELQAVLEGIQQIDACLEEIRPRNVETWAVVAALTAAQGILFAEGCLQLWRAGCHSVAVAPVIRSFLEAYVNFLYLLKARDEALRNLEFAALSAELKALADGELVNVISKEQKVERRSSLKLDIDHLQRQGAKEKGVLNRMKEVWPDKHLRVYELYRILSAVSHSRISWFFRAFGNSSDMDYWLKSDDLDEQKGRIIIVGEAFRSMSRELNTLMLMNETQK